MLGDQVGMIEIQSTDPDKVDEILAPLQPLVRGRGIIVDWRQMNSALLEALEIERIAMFVVLSLIVLVAGLNISSGLIMLVKDKGHDIASKIEYEIEQALGEADATERLTVKVMVLVPLSPSATLTSSIVRDGVGGTSSLPLLPLPKSGSNLSPWWQYG